MATGGVQMSARTQAVIEEVAAWVLVVALFVGFVRVLMGGLK